MQVIPIAGYYEALAEERALRDAAFLDLAPAPVCGVPVCALTLRLRLTLSVAGSPFVVGGRVDREDCLAFLWAVSPGYRATAFQARRRFAAALGNFDTEDLREGIEDYLAQFMDDAPGGSSEGGAAIASEAAYLIDLMRSRFPAMTRAEVLDTRLDELWQYARVLEQRADPNGVFFNKRSDRAKKEGVAAWVAAQAAAAANSSVAEIPNEPADPDLSHFTPVELA